MVAGDYAHAITVGACFQMVKAPAAGKSLPGASSSKQANITDDDIERQLRALGVD